MAKVKYDHITHDSVVCCGDTIQYEFFISNDVPIQVDSEGIPIPPGTIEVTSTFDHTLNSATLISVEINTGSWDGSEWVIPALSPILQGHATATLRIDDDSEEEYFVQMSTVSDCPSCVDGAVKRVAKPLTCYALDDKLNSRESDCPLHQERVV